jgi:NADH dehydrogenase
MNPERIVIVGGGFAGVAVAQNAERHLKSSVDIVVISRDNHLVFSPLLPEVAARGISFMHVAVPGRTITRRTRWMQADVTGIDAKSHTVRYSVSENETAEIAYTHLVLACGSETNLDTIPGLSAHSFPVKTAIEAIILGNEVITRFEQAALEQDEDKRSELLTIVVIGGGFSGVEVAGQLNDLMDEIHPSYPELGGARPKVIVLQGGDKVLPELSHGSLSDFTYRKLVKNGVDVRLKTRVAEVTERGVLLDSGTFVAGGLVVCTIGTAPSRLISGLGLQLEKGRLRTEPDLRVSGLDNVWALGDCAVATNAFDGKPTSATAQFAMREGAHLAKNLSLAMSGSATKAFSFRPQGLLASIGRQNGVAEIYSFRFSGKVAWFLWRAVYLFKMPGLGMKIGVALDWLVGAFFPPPIAQMRVESKPKSRRIHYAAADTIFDSERPSHEVGFIAEGSAALYFDDSSKPFVGLEKGDYFGSVIFNLEGADPPGRVVVKAETSVDVLAVNVSGFSEISELFEPLRAFFESSLQERAAIGNLLRRHFHEEWSAKLRVGDVMSDAGIFLAGNSTLADSMERWSGNVNGFWVLDDDGKKLLGFLGRAEVYRAMASGSAAEPIGKMLRDAPAPLHQDQAIVPAALALLRSEFETLPVVDQNGHVVGLFDPMETWRRVHIPTDQTTSA